MFTDRDKAAARAIVSIHETGKARPGYAAIAILPDGPGGGLQLTFGCHQATDRADSLDRILVRYKELAIETYGDDWDDRTLADELAAYLPLLAENTQRSCAKLAADTSFHGFLRRSADDPLMRRAQEGIFERFYMRPAIEAIDGSGWTEPLSLAVVYDSMVHGSWSRVRDLVHGVTGERLWIQRYVATRAFHLSNAGRPGKGSVFGNPLLRNTVYRMHSFENLIQLGNWGLVAPFRAHGVTVTDDDLAIAA